jgi:hypothetical protein
MNLFGYEIKRKSVNKSEVDNLRPINYTLTNFDADAVIGRFNPYGATNLFTLYNKISELQFPIRFITEKVKNANFVVKRYKDDQIITDKYTENILSKPNPFYSFNDYISLSIAMRLIEGNSYCYALADEAFAKAYYKYAKAFYVLPSYDVNIKTPNDYVFFLTDDIKNAIEYYTVYQNGKYIKIPVDNILHIKDGSSTDIKAPSRLISQTYPISNLMAVYEARNVIYTKRGAMGALVSAKTDDTGVRPLTEKEKQVVNDTFNRRHGLTYDKNQILISQIPVNYLNMGMSIQELEPFRETLNDAIQIASAYNIDQILVPREQDANYTNKETAEAAFYPSVLYPLLEQELQAQSNFMGLSNDGMYFDYYFDNVPVLEASKNAQSESQKKVSERCKIEFDNGLITLNDWRTQIGLEEMKEPIYSKTLLQMNESEIAQINIIKPTKTNTNERTNQ